jgi:hypothetical protein
MAEGRGIPGWRMIAAALLIVVAIPLMTVSAHVVVGSLNPSLARAFVSSPTATADTPVSLVWGSDPNQVDTGLSVACFNVANTSLARPDDPAWPRITAAGFELPGDLSGFTLVSASTPGWSLQERVEVEIPGRAAVTLDVALVAPVNPMGMSVGQPQTLLGIAPGQLAQRGSGTRFCVAGPFPRTLTIEQIINGVVVRFHGVHPAGPSVDFGIWDNAARSVPLY